MKWLIAMVALVLMAAPVQADEIDDYIDLLRQDARGMMKMVVSEVMDDLTVDENEVFWKVYDKYEREVMKMSRIRTDLVRQFAENYFDMDDEMADYIATQSLHLQVKRANLRKDYYRKFRYAVGAKKATRFMQLDLVVSRIIDLQVSSELPLIE
jgi:hypothetical protein